MNRLEFNKIMENNRISTYSVITDENGISKQVYNWNDFSMYFEESYAVVEGIIPKEVINIISQKIPDNDFFIWDVDCYKFNLKYYYQFNSKEGLSIFLTEMQDYYLENMIPLMISAYEYMQSDEKNMSKYNSAFLGPIFRPALLAFDKAINPFLDKDIKIDDIKKYLKRVKIEVKLDSYTDPGKCCTLSIKSLDSDFIHRTTYSISPRGFNFSLDYWMDKDHYLTVDHDFLSEEFVGKNKKETGEVIHVIFKGYNEEEPGAFLNITTGKYGFDDQDDASLEQVVYIYNKLLEAISLAKSITTENMEEEVEKGSSKQLIKKENN